MSCDEIEEMDESGIFWEVPEKLLANLDAIKMRCGESSAEYADYLLEIGDAHMKQGSLSNPKALASYEQALKIFSECGQSNSRMGKVFDKLSNVKESSDDTRGAAADLARAIEFWQKDEANSFAESTYFARRQDDLKRLQGVNKIRYGPAAVATEHYEK